MLCTDYAGLPILSDGYPSLGGKFLVITLSSAACPCGPLDLHVLGTLPTLILSQDQTLHVEHIDNVRNPERVVLRRVEGSAQYLRTHIYEFD